MSANNGAITSRENLIHIVNLFYEKVRKDSLIGPIFTEIARVDWDEHLPKLYNFWEDLILGSNNYHGRPFPPHTRLNLKTEHFEKWLELFTETIDENFAGVKAEEMKARARRIAYNFSFNLGLISTPSVT